MKKINKFFFLNGVIGSLIFYYFVRKIQTYYEVDISIDGYGLAGAVFTKDLARGEKIATELLETGNVAVNNFVASDPRVPFGGIGLSGFGREMSEEGIREFVNIKSVSIDK